MAFSGIVALAVSCFILFLCWRFGARPERLGVAIMAGSTLLDMAYHALVGLARYASIDLGHLIINVSCLTTFTALALRANRVWPLWCSAFQIIMTLGHLGEAVYPSGSPLAYWWMTYLPTIGQLGTISLGVVAHAARYARIGRYRDWRLI